MKLAFLVFWLINDVFYNKVNTCLLIETAQFSKTIFYNIWLNYLTWSWASLEKLSVTEGFKLQMFIQVKLLVLGGTTRNWQGRLGWDGGWMFPNCPSCSSPHHFSPEPLSCMSPIAILKSLLFVLASAQVSPLAPNHPQLLWIEGMFSLLSTPLLPENTLLPLLERIADIPSRCFMCSSRTGPCLLLEPYTEYRTWQRRVFHKQANEYTSWTQAWAMSFIVCYYLYRNSELILIGIECCGHVQFNVSSSSSTEEPIRITCAIKIFLPVCVSVYPSIHLPTYLPTYHLFVCLPIIDQEPYQPHSRPTNSESP